MEELTFFVYITIVVLITALAGVIMGKLKQPVMIGYILAGIVTGPSCLSLISSQNQIHIYSELGIILLLFVIGLELNIKSFLKMWKIPTFFTTIQVVGSAMLACCLANLFSLPTYVALLIAFCACLSSTAAIVKGLEHMGELRTDVGYISIGILVSQDIAVVPMMLVIKECGHPFGASIIAKLVVAIGLVVALIKYLGKKEKIILPTSRLAINEDLVPVITLAVIFVAAAIVQLCGLSAAYGAFLVGLFIGNTQERQNILSNIKPLQDLLLMSFFLSVGLMFNLKFLLQHFFIVLFGLIIITIWKVFFNTVVLRIFNINLAKSTAIGIILAQLGEFSLVLANFAAQSHIIGTYGQRLIVCITALSLTMSPIFIKLSSKVLNLSFIGDNSIKSIVKVIFSGEFSKLVIHLFNESKEIFANKIQKDTSGQFEESIPSDSLNANTTIKNIKGPDSAFSTVTEGGKTTTTEEDNLGMNSLENSDMPANTESDFSKQNSNVINHQVVAIDNTKEQENYLLNLRNNEEDNNHNEIINGNNYIGENNEIINDNQKLDDNEPDSESN